MVDLNVVVAELSDMERNLRRVVQPSTPAASRMPTPLGSFRASSKLARVLHDIHRLSSTSASPNSPAVNFGAVLSVSAASATTTDTPDAPQCGVGGRWPLPTPEELEEDARAQAAALPADARIADGPAGGGAKPKAKRVYARTPGPALKKPAASRRTGWH